MESISETVHVMQRLYQLAAQCEAEADYMADHFRRGHIGPEVYDEVSLLISASIRAQDEALRLVQLDADEADLDRADTISEVIEALIRRVKPGRVLLDNIYQIRRTPTL